ncbi:MAG: hypothetical protein WKF48_07340 [Solirubrobacteraceae bacterium]
MASSLMIMGIVIAPLGKFVGIGYVALVENANVKAMGAFIFGGSALFLAGAFSGGTLLNVGQSPSAASGTT